MSSSRKPLEIDAVWIFWRSFLVFFLVFEWMLWNQLRQMPVRVPGHRLIIFLLAPRATRRSVFNAMILAGCFTLATTMVVQVIVRPLLNRWLTPKVDPSWWMFHLSSGDSPLASVPGRWQSEGRWQPGALVLTSRRIWFFPADWGHPPWSAARDSIERIEAEPSRLARLAPVRNWPELLRLSARMQDDARFAVADPDAVLGWFSPDPHRDDVVAHPRIAPQGAFDA
ncbi:MAG: hypothetical protein ACLQGP_14330 [Isosphaeraceae bacterium]